MTFTVVLQLGLVIDLTNTHRYYPASDWKKEGIKHVKVRNKLQKLKDKKGRKNLQL